MAARIRHIALCVKDIKATADFYEKAFGLKAETLMRMQAAHELAEARLHEDEIEVEKVAA